MSAQPHHPGLAARRRLGGALRAGIEPLVFRSGARAEAQAKRLRGLLAKLGRGGAGAHPATAPGTWSEPSSIRRCERRPLQSLRPTRRGKGPAAA